MHNYTRDVRKAVSDALFFKSCILCANRADSRAVCPSCEKLLDEERLRFPVTDLKVGGGRKIKCASLYKYDSYGDIMTRLLYFIKQEYDKDAFDFAAKKFSYPLSYLNLPENTVIINVPRNAENYGKYGFDQSAEFAKRAKYYCGKKFIYSNLLKRKKGAKEQKKLDSENRKINVHGKIGIKRIKLAFLTRKLKALKIDKPFIVIADDMITTGASIAECESVIRAAFPSAEIFAASLARND